MLGDREVLIQAVTQAGVLADGAAVVIEVWASIPTARIAMYATAMSFTLVNMDDSDSLQSEIKDQMVG